MCKLSLGAGPCLLKVGSCAGRASCLLAMDRKSWRSHCNIIMGPSRGGAALTVNVHALGYLPQEALRTDGGDLVDVHLGLQEMHKALEEGHKVLSTSDVAWHLHAATLCQTRSALGTAFK